MSRSKSAVSSLLDASVVGEEDPGASLEILRNAALQHNQSKRKAPADSPRPSQETNPYLTINCSNNGRCFKMQVQWQQPQAREFTDLLGLVIAEHAVISDVAWAHHKQTGQDPVQLEISATASGKAAVQVKAAAVHGGSPATAPKRKVLHEPFLAANDHVPYGTTRQRMYR